MLFSVQTPAAGGTAFAQFAAAWCYDGNGYILNDTGTSLDVRIGASGSVQTLASGATLPIKLVFSMAELYVRRTDQSTTQVTVEAQVGTGSAGGGTTPVQAGEIATTAAAAAVAGHNADAGAHDIDGRIATAISGLTGSETSAASFGFLPTASGAVNAAALQSAADASPTGGTIYIPAGVYDMAAGVAVPSGAAFRFAAGVTLRKTADFWAFFYAAGIPTRTVTENVTFEGAWTVLSQNGRNSGNGTPVAGLDPQPGYFDVYFTKNWRISGFVFSMLTGAHCFSVHGGACENILVENIKATGTTDGDVDNDCRATIQFQGGSKYITVRNVESDTNDDAVAFNASDYPLNVISAGDIEDVTVENITDKYHGARQVGFSVRMISGSWTDWANGNTYKLGDCANNAGKIYTVSGKTSGTFPLTASTAPTHASGDATGADGITWRFLKVGTFKTADVRNVTIRNLTCYRNYTPVAVIVDDNEYVRNAYPGTEGTSISDNILVDSVKWEPGASGGSWALFAAYQGNVGSVIVRRLAHTDITGTNSLFGLYYDTIPVTVRALTFEDCDVSHSSSVLFRTAGHAGSGVQKLLFDRCEFAGTVGSGNQSTIFVGCTGDVEQYTFRDCKISGFPNLLSIAGDTTGVTMVLDGCMISGCTKIANTLGDNSPFTIYRRNCKIDVDDGSMFANNGSATSPITMISSEAQTAYQIAATGTAWTVMHYATVADFGTTDPIITLAKLGRYKLGARLQLRYDGASFAARPTLTVSYRIDGTENTSQQGIFLLPPMDGETTDARTLIMPDVFISQTGTAKVVTLQCTLSSAYWRGTVTIDQCELTATPLDQ